MKTKIFKRILLIAAFLTTFGGGFALSKIISTSNESHTMKKVTGIGGIFFKCKDPQKIRDWYSKNLGIQSDEYGASFEWLTGADGTKKGITQWSPFSEDTKYFEPSPKHFMINYRVENLEALVEQLKADGVTILDKMETYDYGKFIHIMDIEGNKIELWEPIDKVFEKTPKGKSK